MTSYSDNESISNNESILDINKTKKVLENSLGSLLEEKSFEEIRVVDICQKANIHRSTFYVYFNNKYELLKSILDKYEAKFLEYLQRYKIEDRLINFHIDLMIEVLQYFYFNRKYLKIIFQNNKDNDIIKIFKKYLKNYVTEGVRDMKLKKQDKPYFFDVIGTFYSGAIINVINEWILSDCTIKPQELAECISDIIMQRIFVYE